MDPVANEERFFTLFIPLLSFIHRTCFQSFITTVPPFSQKFSVHSLSSRTSFELQNQLSFATTTISFQEFLSLNLRPKKRGQERRRRKGKRRKGKRRKEREESSKWFKFRSSINFNFVTSHSLNHSILKCQNLWGKKVSNRIGGRRSFEEEGEVSRRKEIEENHKKKIVESKSNSNICEFVASSLIERQTNFYEEKSFSTFYR